MNYEITVELDNGDWVWKREVYQDFHFACLGGLMFAKLHRGTLISITIIPVK